MRRRRCARGERERDANGNHSDPDFIHPLRSGQLPVPTSVHRHRFQHEHYDLCPRLLLALRVAGDNSNTACEVQDPLDQEAGGYLCLGPPARSMLEALERAAAVVEHGLDRIDGPSSPDSLEPCRRLCGEPPASLLGSPVASDAPHHPEKLNVGAVTITDQEPLASVGRGQIGACDVRPGSCHGRF